ncbi:MAG: hypothetical protein B7Z80_07625 [Rhodospirillales bacterium 20-64-7]|nr:MAG: hypothetical protein B7Z80_07625 [Rhodospirillales bacterium 20-64-7]
MQIWHVWLAAPPRGGIGIRQIRGFDMDNLTRPPGREGAQQGGFVPRIGEGHYPSSVAVAIIALSPFIVVSTAALMFGTQVRHDLQMGRFASQLIAGLAIAGYAFGALTGGDLVQRFRQRNLFFICEGMFALGCLLTALAPGVVLYGFGRIFAGFGTGLLLVAAIPPVIQNFPAQKLHVTVVFINIGFFGAVCLGPLVGGIVAAAHGWRWFYGALALIGCANLFASVLVLPVADPPNPGLKLDPWAGVLGLPAVVLPFWAAAELADHGFASPWFWAPLAAGLACFVGLLLFEYHQRDPLSPVKRMFTAMSVIGTLVAMIAGSVFVAFLELAERMQLQIAGRSPLVTGLLFAPLVVSVCVTAFLLGRLIGTRYLPILILAGMACLAAAGALLLDLGPGGSIGITIAIAVLLGLGAGATVSPGLYLAGLPLQSKIIGRVFALVELVRSLADYIIAPVILKLARTGSAKPPLDIGGAHLAGEAALAITLGFTGFGIFLWLSSVSGLPKPDIIGWIEDNKPALESPLLLAKFRRTAKG